MNRKIEFFLSFALCLGLFGASINDAAAARMGGGKSFGSRPSYSTPYQRNQSPMGSGMNRPGAQGQPQMSPAQQKNQGIRDAMAQRGGFGRFLGGMMLGGLLGALFMGGGFENINFMDILVFAGIAFLLMKLLAARRNSAGNPASAGAFGGTAATSDHGGVFHRDAHDSARGPGFNTDLLSKTPAGGGGVSNHQGPLMPADFDVAGFIAGAKAAYGMMQKAWDDADLAELRALTTDKVFGELQDQIRSRGAAPNQTDLLKVDAEILEVRDVGPEREVTVLFDVLMREDRDGRPEQVREVWHFTRTRASRQPTWFLDGIQQLED